MNKYDDFNIQWIGEKGSENSGIDGPFYKWTTEFIQGSSNNRYYFSFNAEDGLNINANAKGENGDPLTLKLYIDSELVQSSQSDGIYSAGVNYQL